MSNLTKDNEALIMTKLFDFLGKKYQSSPTQHIPVEKLHGCFFDHEPDVWRIPEIDFITAVGLAGVELGWTIIPVKTYTGQLFFRGLAVPQHILYEETRRRKKELEAQRSKYPAKFGYGK